MIKICLQCNKEFKTYKSKKKFCTLSCCTQNRIGQKQSEERKMNSRKIKTKLCKNCNKEMVKIVARPSRTSFCSVKCSKVGFKPTEETKRKIKEWMQKNCPTRGKPVPQERKDKLRLFRLGKKNPKITGSKNWNWKGGITSENMKIRKSLEMKLFKKACMERDDFTCQKTGQRGGRLEVHHINNFANFPKLRTDIRNGITLSKESHKEFHHIYGLKNNTREQLEEFLGRKIIKQPSPYFQKIINNLKTI